MKKQIRDFLLNLLHRENPSLRGNFISFREIKGSAADLLARKTYLKDKIADRKITLKEIQSLYE